MKMEMATSMALLFVVTAAMLPSSSPLPSSCLSYCGNLTVSFPFSTAPGCGHPAFRDLLFCINGILLLHLPSSSLRVLSIDYPFRSLVLHDPAMSTCHRLPPPSSPRPPGFVMEPWRDAYLQPASGNVFLLLGCAAESPLFQGFPARRAPCRNVSGMGCEDFVRCPAWEEKREGRGWEGRDVDGEVECCALPYSAMRAVNLSRLGCQGYSSAYTVAPLRSSGASEWSYGIRLSYTVPVEHDEFCRACEATGGSCGFEETTLVQLCMCEGWNSTSNCDSGPINTCRRTDPPLVSTFLFIGFFISKLTWISTV